MPKHELRKYGTSRYAKEDRGEHQALRPQLCRESCRHPRNAEWGKYVTQGRGHPLAIQYQMAIAESMTASNIIQAVQIIFRNIYVHMCTYRYVTTV